MRKITISATLGYILLLFIAFPNELAVAQNKPPDVNEASKATFESKNGDRVAFLGNSLFENDLQYGYLELALTTRWPDRDVTYRNLGWSGDDVFGNARSYFTNPPTAYDLLMEQITKAKPTVVFIAYGGIEAQESAAGLPRFNEGLNKLLDTIDNLGAKSILLSPIPLLSGSAPENLAAGNKNLELYAAAIAKVAAARGKQFIDLFNPVQNLNKKVKLSDNGVHLNETGYYYLANIIEKELGLTSAKKVISLNVSKKGLEANAPAIALDSGNSGLKFEIQEEYLPLPLPAEGGEIADNARILKVNGLKKGFYTLTADDAQVITASAKKWAEGVEIRKGASFTQSDELRRMILKKNDLFFQQYRPMNRTYIVGFRSYEQGRHKQGLEDLNFIITWLEGQIKIHRTPKSLVYQLIPVK